MFEVMLKELRELLRDRKTLFFVIALPIVIFPVLFAFVAFLTSKAALEAEQKVHTFYVVNEDFARPFAETLFYHRSFKRYEGDTKLDSVDALSDAVRRGIIDVGIYIPSTPKEQVTLGEQTRFQVVFNDAQSINFIYGRIKKAIDEYSAKLTEQALTELGVEANKQAAVLKPVIMEKVDTADRRENIGEKIGAFIPYMLIPLVLMGASYPAIDLGAGEKERGTLETLLLTPLTRTQLVLGKFLTILISSIACALVTVSSMAIWIGIASGFGTLDPILSAFSSVTQWDFLLIFALLLPVAMMLSSLVLAISIYARSFKEAQNYMGPLSMLVFVPIVVSVLPNMTLNAKTAWIPITNVALAIKEIVKGTVDYQAVALIFLASTLLAAALLGCCVRWFSRESVLFR
ncbi:MULTISPECIES: ABC transporter permease [unclassified Pseudoalteromonas]|uniref:ABC transporter permease n=1 Tax=unclassified Pseudoalteromonas TaxID=194690 RepID=UPI002097E59A|nr:ABC transporter permease [Pseudoalteromonas sp. XMcav2-N]MCO7187827.1 ABC transporter permease [Pseudoalteromonas sp. XMcav2-N]